MINKMQQSLMRHGALCMFFVVVIEASTYAILVSRLKDVLPKQAPTAMHRSKPIYIPTIHLKSLHLYKISHLYKT